MWKDNIVDREVRETSKLFGVVPMRFVLPVFHRYFFRMTGKIYLGPMVTCLVFVMILISNTVIYLPL
jgi:hypothetical protein